MARKPKKLDPYICPVCDDPIESGDLCATDIDMGTCHADCLKGSPVVDLETGEPLDGEPDTFAVYFPSP